MQRTEVKYFFPEEEYKRYIIGRFKNESFVPSMLKEYGELCIDSPQISEYYKHGEWTIIPCPIELINRGCFLDLMNWLTQENEEAFAIALHPEKSYFARNEAQNIDGDTVFVEFDDGIVVRWFLPPGLVNDDAFMDVDPDTLEFTNMLAPCTCKEFLSFMGAGELIEHFNISNCNT